jgi:iron complex outermembrane receptor protein
MRYIITFFLQFLILSLFAQNNSGLVKGKVFDFKTRQSLIGVQIIYDKNSDIFTDSEGNFEFSAEAGKSEIVFILSGYQTLKKNIVISPNSRLELNIGLEELLNEINEIVVSADKTEKSVSELSVSMSVIKQFDITKNHFVNAKEILNKIQGIEITDGQASIRGGSGFSYGAGSRVLALIDGLPAVSADAGNIRWQFLPIENLSQIEVIKGASSVLYGSSALNGVVNFITAQADVVPQIKFSLSSGIYDKPQNKNWVWWNSPRMYSDFSFSYSQKIKNTEIGFGSNVLIDNGYRKSNDDKLARINFKIKQNSFKIENLSYGLGFIAGFNQKKDFVLWENAETGALIQNETTVTNLNALYFTFDPFVSYKSANSGKHDLRIRLQYSNNNYPENNSNNSTSIFDFSEYQYSKRFFEKLDFIFGVSSYFSKITSQFYGNHSGTNVAGYSQAEYTFFTNLKLSAGIRFEYNALDGISDKLVPIFRTGLNYKLAKASFLRASFGQGYRYPSIAEKYAFTTLGAVKIFPNSEVKPEKGWSSEIGVKQGLKFGEIIGQADVCAFYSENTDMIEYVFGLYPDPITQVFDLGFRSSNIENSRVYGAETEFLLNRNFGKINLKFGGGYTYIYPVEFNTVNNQSTEIYLKYRKKHSGKFYIGSSFKKFEIGFNAYLKSKTLNIDDVFLNPITREGLLPGFYDYWSVNNKGSFVLDGFLSYRITDNIKFSFSVKNIGNVEYMGRPGDIQPQRFYSFQLSGRF